MAADGSALPMNTRGKYIRLIFGTMLYPDVAEGIMEYLGASEASFLWYITGASDNFPFHRRYLNPFRDIDPSMQTVHPLIERGYTVLLIGPDVHNLIKRILSPREYWRRTEQLICMKPSERRWWNLTGAMNRNRLRCWVVCFHPHCDQAKVSEPWGPVVDQTVLINGQEVHNAYMSPGRTTYKCQYMVQGDDLGLSTNTEHTTLKALMNIDAGLRRNFSEEFRIPVSDICVHVFMSEYEGGPFARLATLTIGSMHTSIPWLKLFACKPDDMPNFAYIDVSTCPLEVVTPEIKDDMRLILPHHGTALPGRVRFGFRTQYTGPQQQACSEHNMDRMISVSKAMSPWEVPDNIVRAIAGSDSIPAGNSYHCIDIPLRKPFTDTR